jgi:hypothetical protein
MQRFSPNKSLQATAGAMTVLQSSTPRRPPLRLNSIVRHQEFEPRKEMMNAGPMDVLRQWALQTVTFAMTVENAAKTGVSPEVVEQTAVPASRISNQFFAESTAAAGTDAARVDRVFPELVNRVLDWVADRRGKSIRS